jgi:hypothetical protein
MVQNPRTAVKKISENISKGKKVILGEILREVGYSESVCESPQRVTETKAFKEESKPIIDRWIKERDRITSYLETKDLTEEKYRDMVVSLDTLTKNIQLLSGGETERSGITFNVMNYGDTNPPPIST